MFIIHLALGGCLKAPPVDYGITADTGGHIAYVLDAAAAQSRMNGVDHVTIVTRLFADDDLGPRYSIASEPISANLDIRRIATTSAAYLEKEALAAELSTFADGFCDYLADLPRLPDVIHAHFADAAAVAMTAERRFGIPFAYTPHALGIDKQRQGGSSAALDARIVAERAAIAAAGAIIVSTFDETERQIGGYGVPVADRVRCISPGVPHRDTGVSNRTIVDRLSDWLDDPCKPILLAIARPVAKKNLSAVLRAFAGNAALRDMANVVLLAGRHDYAVGEERQVLDSLEALAADPRLRGKVCLPADHDASDVAALYRRAAIGGVFVNPAHHEPFGLTIIEAAAAGVPVVATRNGGPVEIVADLGHGLLVDPRDDHAIADACLRIIGDANVHAAFSASGLASIGSYSWDRYAGQSVGAYAAAARPRLLASDIDNTLTGCAASARAFAGWAAERKIPFVVATGRSFDDARAVLDEWGLPAPDAYIVDVGTRIMLRDGSEADRSDTPRWRACSDYAATLDRSWDREAIANALEGLALDAQPLAVQTPHKMSFFGGEDIAAAIRRTLAEARLAARVVFSHGRLIDILPPFGGKAAAVAAYAASLGEPLSACIAAGDSGNDADMLAACGHAILVANADDDLVDLPKRPGLYRANSPHAAGVLEGLARHGLAPTSRAAMA